VTLFASGDSRTEAKLVAPVPRALRLAKSVDPLALHLLLVEQIAQCADEFDVIHFHIAPLHFSIARRLSIPHVTTLHGRLDLPEVVTLYGEFSDLPLVSVSDAQRGPIPDQNWVGTVYHGLPNRELQFSAGAGGYLAFLGRISTSRRRAAVRSRSRLKWILPISGTSSSTLNRYSIIHSSTTAERSRKDRRVRFSALRRRCCFRSIGPSPLVWS
jgi:glycosyltransferase involved in cell wall biosynthesis